MIRAAALALVVVAASEGCSSPPAARPPAEVPWVVVRSVDAGFEVAMPVRPVEKRAHEGPVRVLLYTSRDEDGTSYEVASFDLPDPLTAEERAHLLERVQVGLAGGPDATITSSREVATAGASGRELVIRHGEREQGTWRILYVGDQRMLQVSAVGSAPRPADVRRFFASFRVIAPAPQAPP